MLWANIRGLALDKPLLNASVVALASINLAVKAHVQLILIAPIGFMADE